jgi:RNA polymerase sigma-70 factor (ECF subfamily)
MAQVTAQPGTDARAAVESLLGTHGPRLYALARRLCGHEQDAQDLVQEVFLIALRSWGSFRGQSDPGTWLHTIAARTCKARLRRKGGIDRRMPALSQVAPWTETRASTLGRDDPMRAGERAEAIEAVQAGVVRLPEDFRLALVLKDVLGLSVKDVASTLGIKEQTVKTRVHRARLLLRKGLLRGLPTGAAPRPAYEKRVCVDLLKAKMDALDAGRTTALGPELVCERCRGVFEELNLVKTACAEMSRGRLPAEVRRAVLGAIREGGRGR